jgi:hypothetical protein
MKKLRIIVGGYIGLLPSGGVTWDYIQYPLGLHLLGHDVYYFEDTRQYSKYQSEGQQWDDATNSIQYLKHTMEKFGLGERWAYRDIATDSWFGLSAEKVKEVFETADLFINVSAATFLRDEYLKIPKRVLIDSDPMFTQVQYWNDNDHEKSYKEIQQAFTDYHYLFTFGENINGEDCKIPKFGYNWIPTRQPICLDYWEGLSSVNDTNVFTTVMNFSSKAKMIYHNEEWGQKDVEFEKFKQLPKEFNKAKFQIIAAIGHAKINQSELKETGWDLADPLEKIRNADEYKEYIQHSLGEFSVAKETYVKSDSGWFSCRSACYLAAGKPVVTQETQWSKFIPAGQGLFSFTDSKSAMLGLEAIVANPAKHSKTAKEIAREYFDSSNVLTEFLSHIQ